MATNNAPQKLRVLFVCLGNSCRSPMAEAIARQTAGDVMTVSSAGTIALGTVAPFTLRVLEERGYDSSGLQSKPLTEPMKNAADVIINMTGVPTDRFFAPRDPRILEWQIFDPYNCPIKDYRQTCDEIEIRIAELAARIRAQFQAPLGAISESEPERAPDSGGDSSSASSA